MDVAATEPGLCPGCEDPGPVATPCARPVCTRRGLCFVPYEYVGHAAPDPLVGRLVGGYLVVRLLGAGGFGKVYLALQLPILMRAAVKILHRGSDDPDEQRRMAAKFLSEARALATLNHPNVVRLLQFGVFEDTAYLAMEFVDGGTTLRDLVQRRAAARDPLTTAEVGDVLRQLLDALEAAHLQSIVHRDVKPENIMVQSVPGHPLFVRVLDFGLAKFVSEQTETSAAIGTPVYMAPEQVLRRHIGTWTDIYAVGALAFELLTGRRPYQGDSVHEIFVKKLDDTTDPLADAADLGLPDATAAFFRAALAFDHTARLQDVPACRAALEPALRALSLRDAAREAARAPEPAPPPREPSAPERIEHTPTRLEPAMDLASLRTPPVRSTDTVDRHVPRRPWRRVVLVAGVAALIAVRVVLALTLGRSSDDGPLARRLPESAAAYYHVRDVARFRERLVAEAGLSQPEVLRRALDPWLGRAVDELAKAAGVRADTAWDVLDHARSLEVGLVDGAVEPVAMITLDAPGLGQRVLTEVGARHVASAPDRYRLDSADLELALVEDAVLVGRGAGLDAVLRAPERALTDSAAYRAARAAVPADSDAFVFIRPPPLPPSVPFPRLAWVALGARASGAFTLEAALPDDAPLPDFVVRPARSKALMAQLPRGTLLAWAASVDGASKVRQSFARWLDALPPEAARAVREDLGLDAAPGDLALLGSEVALIGQDLFAVALPVATELAVAIVRDDDGRLAPLLAFDIEDEAQAQTLASKLFDEGTRRRLPWQSVSLGGARLRYVDLGDVIRADGGGVSTLESLAFDFRLGWVIHDGLFVVGGVDAIRALLAARADRAPRLGEGVDVTGLDADNALQLALQAGDLVHGPRSPLAPIAALQQALARAVAPAASFGVSVRLAALRVRIRTNAPLVALGLWLRLVGDGLPPREVADAEPPPGDPMAPAPDPMAPAPDPMAPAPEPTPEPNPTDVALTPEQLDWPLETASGARTTLGDLPRDEALLVTFWAAWCVPCVEQLPVLTDGVARLGPRWRLVHLSSDASWDALRELASRPASPLPSLEPPLVLRDARVSADSERPGLRGTFGTTLMPDSVVIFSGRVLDRFTNAQAWTSPDTQARLMSAGLRAGIPLPNPTDEQRAAAARWVDGGTLVLAERFDRPAFGEAWQADAGWSISDGAARSSGADARLWLTAALPERARVELTVSSNAGELACWVGGERASAAPDVGIIQDAWLRTADAIVRSPDDGRAAVRPTAFEADRRYRWTLIRTGGAVYWLVDGELRLAREDLQLPVGRDFGCGGPQPMTVEDLRVYALDP